MTTMEVVMADQQSDDWRRICEANIEAERARAEAARREAQKYRNVVRKRDE